MASEPHEPGSSPRTLSESEPPTEHPHLESVAQASDLDHAAPSSEAGSEGAGPPGSDPPHTPHAPHAPHAPHTPDDEEDGGGPVKTFIEHLEDLRWMIIKAGGSVLIGMVVCLVAAPYVIDTLLLPLRKADLLRDTSEGVILLKLDTNVLWRLPGNGLPGIPAGTNRVDSYQLVPFQEGSNILFVLQREASAVDDAPPARTAIKNYGPLDPFTVALQVALYGGLGLASPFVLLFIGEFVVPALKRKEKRFLYRGLGIGAVLFMLGVVFCYFVMLQIALNAAINFSRWMNFGADEWRAQEYLSFVLKFLLGMGLAFELPVVLLTLVKIGLLDHRKLSKFRPYWIVVNLILSAALTPPDPFSMLMMALPLQVLYEISVFIARVWGREKSAPG